MRVAMGIDLGSTSVTAVAVKVLDDRAEFLASASAPNENETTSPSDRLIGRSEWDILGMVESVARSVRDLCEKTNADDVVAIGITGQQQGCQLLNEGGEPVGPFIGWQDQRCKDRVPGTELTFLDLLAERGSAIRQGEGLPMFRNAGCPIVTGYTVPTLFWLNHMGEMPSGVAAAITAPEFLSHKLVGTKRPATDATDAAGWGVLDVPRRQWNEGLIESLDIERDIFPEIRNSCTIRGGLTNQMAKAFSIRSGTPIAIPSGDHQCSFVGAVADANDTVAINIGTGGQATVYVEDPTDLRRNPNDGTVDHGWLELRPHIERGYLLAGVGVVGGRTFRALKDFFVRTARNVFELDDVNDDMVYEKLAELAETEMSDGSIDGINASALFTGSREHPDERGEFSNVTPGNFTPGSMTLAVFRSMAAELADSYRSAVDLGAGPRSQIVGSGNGLRLNAALRRCVEDAFGGELTIGGVREEAAVGAALTAAVSVGVYPEIGSASRALVR